VDEQKIERLLVEQIFSRAVCRQLNSCNESVLMVYYHCFVLYGPAVLSELKISSLEAQKKVARQGYQEHLQAYVTSYLGQPLEKVHVSSGLFYEL